MDFKFNGKEFSIFSIDIKNRDIYNNGRVIGKKICITDFEDKKNKFEFNIIVDCVNSKDKKYRFQEQTYVSIMDLLDDIYDSDMSIDEVSIECVKGDLSKISYTRDNKLIVVDAI